MRVDNKNLEKEIKMEMTNKFGKNVSLNKLYETILRRMVYDIKANLNETILYFNKRIRGNNNILIYATVLRFIPYIYFSLMFWLKVSRKPMQRN